MIRKINTVEDGYKNLGLFIIYQGVQDFKKRGKTDELTQFFNSDWFDSLCINFGVEASCIKNLYMEGK